jgi:hypothetical protein
MRLPAMLSVAVLLGLASSAQALPVLNFHNSFTDRHSIIIGMDYFTAGAPFEHNSWPDPSMFTAGYLQITSGPLRDVTVIDEFETLYRYEQGSLRLDLSWLTPTGALATGSLTARLPPLDVLIEELDRTDPEHSTPDYPRTFAYYSLTRGRLDPSLAAYLGASRHTQGIFLDWWLENISGSPPPFDDRVAHHIVADQLRVAVQTRAAVPEPSLLLLAFTAVAVVGLTSRRRRET